MLFELLNLDRLLLCKCLLAHENGNLVLETGNQGHLTLELRNKGGLLLKSGKGLELVLECIHLVLKNCILLLNDG